jgi:hypothetical protein
MFRARPVVMMCARGLWKSRPAQLAVGGLAVVVLAGAGTTLKEILNTIIIVLSALITGMVALLVIQVRHSRKLAMPPTPPSGARAAPPAQAVPVPPRRAIDAPQEVTREVAREVPREVPAGAPAETAGRREAGPASRRDSAPLASGRSPSGSR